MPVLRSVIFDLDDTLYSEQNYVLSGFQAVAAWAEEHLGIPEHVGLAELRDLFESGVRGDTFNRWLQGHDLSSDDLALELVNAYREHNPRIAPYKEVPELLQRLRRRYSLGLVSDGYLDVQRRKFESLGLSIYMDAVAFSDEWGRAAWKPSTTPFENILETLETSGRETAYVGDNPSKDFVGARKTGMWTVRFRHPEGVYSHLEPLSADHAADFEITSLDCLEETLAQIEQPTALTTRGC